MSDKISVDATQMAIIRFGDGTPHITTPTLQEAVLEFGKLAPEKKAVAIIQTESGERFTASDVEKFHFE
jgi:hypothetical protein